MLSALSWLALEVKYLDRARPFYEQRLGLTPVRSSDRAVVYRAGETELHLRAPGPVPRGGLHVHYAFSTPPAAYETWNQRFADLDPDEVSFGRYQSLYVDDPDDHCVEVGNNGEAADTEETGDREGGADGAPLTGIFEVVLEVESLARAQSFYESLGFDVVDEGADRPRARLRGPFDLELWEPHLGLADARGGVHVDLGFACPDPTAAVDAVREAACDVEDLADGGTRVRDADGHYLTFHD
jgi:catechol-2,3-dioxygenase